MTNELTMEQEATEYAARLIEVCAPFVAGEIDSFDDADERVHDLPDAYGHDILIRVHCYGGGPAGGVEFDCVREPHGLDFSSARTWHQDWFQPKGYAQLDTGTAEFLFQHWGLEYALEAR